MVSLDMGIEWCMEVDNEEVWGSFDLKYQENVRSVEKQDATSRL